MDLKKQVVVNITYRILFLFLQVVITLIVPRITGPDGFGLYSIVITNASLLLTVTSFGIPSGLAYHASKRDWNPAHLNRMLYYSTLLQFLLIVAGEIIFLQFNNRFGIWPTANIKAGALGILFFVSIVLTEKYYSIYNGYNALKEYNKVTVVFSAVTIAALISSMIIFGQIDTDQVIAISIVIVCIQTIILARGSNGLLKKSEYAVQSASNTIRNFFGYSFKSYVANIFQFLANRVDYWILLYFAGQTQLGYYSLSSRLGQLFLILPLIISAVIFPSTTSTDFRREQLDRQIRLMNSLNILVAILGALLSYYLIPVFFGIEFQSSVLPFIILIPGMLLKSLTTMLATYFAGKGLVDINLRNSALSVLVVVILDFILIPEYHTFGAAIAITIANLVSSIYALKKYIEMNEISSYRLFASLQDINWLRNFSSQFIRGIGSK